VTSPRAVVVVMMGVSGSGKTTLGEALAQRLDWRFQEGDDLHPAANIEKMKSGRPLTDADRAPWLARVAAWIDGQLAAGRSGVITCSALKRAYRDRIVGDRPSVRLVYLQGERDLLRRRIEARKGHFMPPGLLDSQFADLEPPAPEERAIVIEVARPIAQNLDRIIAALG
jgi:carbohydrate kinase (thermoresistant glucokinase family)